MHSINASWKESMSAWCPRSRHVFWKQHTLTGSLAMPLSNTVTTRPYSSLFLLSRKPHFIFDTLFCLTCVRAGSPLIFKSTRRGKWSEETLLYKMDHSSITSFRHADNSTWSSHVRERHPYLINMNEDCRWECPHVNYHHVAVSTHALNVCVEGSAWGSIKVTENADILLLGILYYGGESS
ncbi:hypothetical protein GWK47_017876 [Chionoecetes opilio]|uniref:Uncharacterized protein n=1 Tax=Chionoecetes opilio TaxID=41210 RepID=A0A8J5CLW7_CHIOP|nr:hypothetical protein GWK47_017876 [Chionoecetes opilio]